MLLRTFQSLKRGVVEGISMGHSLSVAVVATRRDILFTSSRSYTNNLPLTPERQQQQKSSQALSKLAKEFRPDP